MATLKISPITDAGENALKSYIDSVTTPCAKDKLNMFMANKINKAMFKRARMSEIKMVREEWDEKSQTFCIIVENGYEQYSKELLENGKKNFLKLMDKFEAEEIDFSIEVDL